MKKYPNLFLIVSMLTVLLSCSNSEKILEPMVSYQYELKSNIPVEKHIEKLLSVINANEIRILLESSSEKILISDLGVTYSTFNSEDNCFVDTSSCRVYNITVLVLPYVIPKITEKQKILIQKYINNAVSSVSHNKSFKTAGQKNSPAWTPQSGAI